MFKAEILWFSVFQIMVNFSGIELSEEIAF